MARQSNQDRLDKIHREAMREFDDIQAAVREERLQCLEDRRFYALAGAQWEGPLGRQFENKPRFEFNKVNLAVLRVVNEYRNNRITVDFTSKDGSSTDTLPDACDGLYRADEKSSTAEEAYDNAFEDIVGGGIGAWRYRSCYEDEDDDENDKQRIAIEPIYDADSCVFFDLGAKRQDKADAKRCYVLTAYTPDDYKEEFGESPSDWPREIQRTEFDWCTPDIVWVCELYRVEEKRETVRYFRGLDDSAEDMRVTDSDIEADPQLLEELAATGFTQVREKRVERRVVRKYILSGGGVLEDCGVIPGKCIPVVIAYGQRRVIDGVERSCGLVRHAKDAQRLINMLMSWLASMAARFDIEKPIFDPRQISKYAYMWAEDNVSQFPYLLADMLKDSEGNPIPGSGQPQGYTKAPNVPPSMAMLAQIAEQALQDLLGNQQAGEQLQPNISGKTMELIQNRLDMQAFIYMSNFKRAMKRGGEIWLSMMKDVIVEKSRRMKTVGANGEVGSVVLNKPAYDRDTARQYLINDMTKANFEVDVDVGPSSTSRRASTVRSLVGVMQFTQDPETLQVLTNMVLMNLEGEGMNDVRSWARDKMVAMGVVKPTEEEASAMAQQQAQQQPDPQSQYLLAAAANQEQDAALKRAKADNTAADTQLKQAQTVKTMAEAGSTQTQDQLSVAQAMQPPPPPPTPAGVGGV
jgi:Phage P22-like portal protein